MAPIVVGGWWGCVFACDGVVSVHDHPGYVFKVFGLCGSCYDVACCVDGAWVAYDAYVQEHYFRLV